MVDIPFPTAENRRAIKKEQTRMWASAQRDGRPDLCLTPQSFADAHCYTAVQQRCQDAKPVESSWVPQTNETIPAASGRSSPYCKDVWEKYCCLIFFPVVDTCFCCRDVVRQSCAMVRIWRIFGDILRPVFSASRVQRTSDLHRKFALRPDQVWKYGRHPICEG